MELRGTAWGMTASESQERYLGSQLALRPFGRPTVIALHQRL
jgi:hypothetical protein